MLTAWILIKVKVKVSLTSLENWERDEMLNFHTYFDV
jgi:hypothetical protein